MPRDVAHREGPDPVDDQHYVTKGWLEEHFGAGGVLWAESTTTGGVTKGGTGTGTGPYNCHQFTSLIRIPVPLKVTHLLVDFPGAGEYAVHIDAAPGRYQVDDLYHLLTVAASVVITSEEAEVTFGQNKQVDPDDGAFILTPGAYFFTLEAIDPATKSWDYKAARWTIEQPGDKEVVHPLSTPLWGWLPFESWADDFELNSVLLPLRITAYKGSWVV